MLARGPNASGSRWVRDEELEPIVSLERSHESPAVWRSMMPLAGSAVPARPRRASWVGPVTSTGL